VAFLSYSGGTWNLAQRFIASPSGSDARKAALLSSALFFTFPLVLFLPMWASPLIFPALDEPQQVYALMAREFLPPGLLGLVVAAMFAATMSMTASDSNAVAAVITRDILPGTSRRFAHLSPARSLRVARVTTFVFTAATLLVAVYADTFGGILGLIVVWFTGLLGPTAVPMILGLIPAFRHSGPAAAIGSWVARGRHLRACAPAVRRTVRRERGPARARVGHRLRDGRLARSIRRSARTSRKFSRPSSGTEGRSPAISSMAAPLHRMAGMLAYFKLPLGWGELFKRTARETQADNGLGLAAQLAYYFFLALFPALLFLVALAGTLPADQLVARIVSMLDGVAPPEVLGIIRDQLVQISEGGAAGLLTFGVLAALWSSSAAMVAVIDALNRAYDVEDARPWWKQRLTAILLTIGVALFILIAFVLVIAGPQLAEYGSRRRPAWVRRSSGPGRSSSGRWSSPWSPRASASSTISRRMSIRTGSG
jgi:hypothetical protein